MKEKAGKARAGSRGTVTVFLTLILVPCLIFTCAFGDVSRVELSKSQAASAADLALYSLLSNYDANLKEWYGLVASSQSVEDFYDKTEQYFIGMLSANGLDDVGSGLFLPYLSALASEDGYSDFLQIEEVSNTVVGALTAASLGDNTALLEDGIVEFMKYRGPVVITQNLIERFSSLDIIGKLKQAKENEPIVKKKQEYAEAEAEMMEDILGTYLALLQYKNFYQDNIKRIGSEQYAAYAEKMDLIYKDMGAIYYERIGGQDKEYEFGGVTDLITKYYAFSDDLKDLSKTIPSVGGAPYLINDNTAAKWKDITVGMNTIGAIEKLDDENEPTGEYTIDDQAILALLTDLDTYIKNIEDAAKNINSAVGSIPAPEKGPDAEGNVNPVVYCMRFQKSVNTNDFATMTSNARAMMTIFVKIVLAEQCERSSYGIEQLSDAKKKIQDTQKNYLTVGTPNGAYETNMLHYMDTIPEVIKFVPSRNYPFNSYYFIFKNKANQVTIGAFFEEIREDLGETYKLIDEQIKNIDLIIDGGKVSYPYVDKDYDVLSLDELKEVMEDTNKKRDEWGKEASKHSTDFAKQEYDDYTGEAEQVGDGKAEKVLSAQNLAAQLRQDPETAVNELKTRLLNIRADLVSLKESLDNFKYGEEKIKDLTRNKAVKAFQSVYTTDCFSTDITLTGCTEQAKGYTKGLLKPGADELYHAPVIQQEGTTSNNPLIEQDPPELAKYLMEAINESQLQDATDKKATYKKQLGDLEEDNKKKREDALGFSTKYVANIGSDPEKQTAGSPFDGFAAFTGIIDLIGTVINGNFGQIRDQIYFVSYVLEMFSYSTFDNEGQIRYALDKEDRILALKEFTEHDNGYHYPDPYYQTWATYKPTDFTDNLTLTNYAINKDNNFSNLAEIEYILYGNKTNEDNLKKAYAQILTIREPLNLVSGFQNFYSGSSLTAHTISTIAAAICGATAGLVPVPAIKAALILILATLETFKDLERLKSGQPVAIYKMKPEEWYCSIGGVGVDNKDKTSTSLVGKMQTDAKVSGEPQDKDGLYYSDYLTLFLLLGANDNGTYKYMLRRAGDLIESNMKHKYDENFTLNKSICYFSLSSKLKVKPLLITLPIVNSLDGVDASELTEKVDWCTYTVKYVRGYS